MSTLLLICSKLNYNSVLMMRKLEGSSLLVQLMTVVMYISINIDDYCMLLGFVGVGSMFILPETLTEKMITHNLRVMLKSWFPNNWQQVWKLINVNFFKTVIIDL